MEINLIVDFEEIKYYTKVVAITFVPLVFIAYGITKSWGNIGKF